MGVCPPLVSFPTYPKPSPPKSSKHLRATPCPLPRPLAPAPPPLQTRSYFYPSNVDRRVARLMMSRNFSDIRWGAGWGPAWGRKHTCAHAISSYLRGTEFESS